MITTQPVIMACVMDDNRCWTVVMDCCPDRVFFSSWQISENYDIPLFNLREMLCVRHVQLSCCQSVSHYVGCSDSYVVMNFLHVDYLFKINGYSVFTNCDLGKWNVLLSALHFTFCGDVILFFSHVSVVKLHFRCTVFFLFCFLLN